MYESTCTSVRLDAGLTYTQFFDVFQWLYTDRFVETWEANPSAPAIDVASWRGCLPCAILALSGTPLSVCITIVVHQQDAGLAYTQFGMYYNGCTSTDLWIHGKQIHQLLP